MNGDELAVGGGTSNSMIASYGVYGDTNGEDGGFYPEHHVVVVKSQKDGTTTNSLVTAAAAAQSGPNAADHEEPCQWCWCSKDSGPAWCKPAVLVLVLVLLLVLFLLVSGILLYFNCK